MHPTNSSNPNPSRPQNKSCPAGGFQHISKSLPSTKRGVIVTPPYGYTSQPAPSELVVLHKGFDTLVLSVKAHIPLELFEPLEFEKARASAESREVQFEFGAFTFLLRPYGGHGYEFILSGGASGATWFLKKPNSKDPWGVRVNVGSFFLATEGLAAVREHLDAVLASWGVCYREEDISIARVDVCVDILAPDFVLIPDQVVMHSSCKRRDHLTADDIVVHGKSSRVTSITIGKPLNGQIIIYDKTSEIVASRKSYWWQIWDHTLRKKHGGEGITSDLLRNGTVRENIGSNRVWRIEARAGKNLLKDRWNIRTWADLYTRYGDVIREAFEVVRYCEPLICDTNRARWPAHAIWTLAESELNDDLIEMFEGTDPNPLKEVHCEDHIALIARNVLGCCITIGALKGKRQDELPALFHAIAREMQDTVNADPVKTAKQLNDASERYVFISKPKPQTDCRR